MFAIARIIFPVNFRCETGILALHVPAGLDQPIAAR
jgi:hypothetical protein